MSEPVVVGRYLAHTDAELARSVLDAAGIPAFLADEEMTRVVWLYAIALGGARLYVPEEFETEARTLLAGPEGSTAILSDEVVGVAPESSPSESCPLCGRMDVQYTAHDRRLRALSMLLLWVGIPFLAWGKRLRCADCGATWKPGFGAGRTGS